MKNLKSSVTNSNSFLQSSESPSEKLIIKVIASSIAACIGENPYKSREIAMMECYKKSWPIKYNEMMKNKVDYISVYENEFQSLNVEDIVSIEDKEIRKDNIEKEIHKVTPNIEKAIIVEYCQKNNIEQIPDKVIHLPISLEKKKEVDMKIKTITQTIVNSKVNTERGIIDEIKAIQIHEEKVKAKIIPSSNFRTYYYDIPLFETDTTDTDDTYELENYSTQGNILRISGKIDGMSSHINGEIVEVKNRQNRLFGFIPNYEMIQIQTYLRMTKSKKCHFVERYGSSESKSYEVLFDEERWESIEYGLKLFGNELTSKYYENR